MSVIKLSLKALRFQCYNPINKWLKCWLLGTKGPRTELQNGGSLENAAGAVPQKWRFIFQKIQTFPRQNNTKSPELLACNRRRDGRLSSAPSQPLNKRLLGFSRVCIGARKACSKQSNCVARSPGWQNCQKRCHQHNEKRDLDEMTQAEFYVWFEGLIFEITIFI